MFCIKCGNYCPEGDTFCAQCGTALPENQTAPKKKGRLWVPMVIMLVFIVIGFSAFFLIRETVDPDMPWFGVKYGTLSFHEDSYTGGSNLDVPAAIMGEPVINIDDYCFSNIHSIEVITVQEGVQSVGAAAFANARGLRAVNLPKSVTSVGTGAFANCVDLEAVCFSASVEYMDASDFLGCENLRYIYFYGTQNQWKNTFNGAAPEGVTIYLTDGDSYQEYNPS